MRFLVYFVAVLISIESTSDSQEKKKEKERPRLFQGGLIKRFEDLQEKLRKDREERLKKRDEDAKKLADRLEDQLRGKRNRDEKDRDDSRRAADDRNRDPYAPSRNVPLQNSSRRNPKLPTAPQNAPAPEADLVSGPRSKASLGVEVKPTGIATAGLIVKKIDRSGPASAAGIRVDDRIVSVGGSTIKRIEDLDLIMSAFEPGDRTEIEVIRKNKKEKLLVDFPGAARDANALANNSPRNTEELPGPGGSNKRSTRDGSMPPVLPLLQAPNNPSSRNQNALNQNALNQGGQRSNATTEDFRTGIGVTAVAVDPVLYARQNLSVRQGAYLEEVLKKSAAEEAGLKTGDVVIAVDGRKVDSALTMAELIQTYKPDDKAQILFYRQNRLKRTEIKMDAVPASQFDRFAAQQNPNQNRATQPPKTKQKSFLGGLGDEFPRLKKVENLIDRFTPRDERNIRAPATGRATGQTREVELENEVQSLRNRLRGQDQQIRSLTEKLSLIEKMLSERQADKSRNNNK